MSTNTTSTEQPELTKPETMGVASLATKRHLESPENGDEVVAAKIAKLNANNNNVLGEMPLGGEMSNGGDSPIIQDSAIVNGASNAVLSHENSSELLTTSILARTLLTSSTSTAQYSSDPLESLKSSLEALPAPAILDTAGSSPYLSTLNGSSNKSCSTIGQNGGDLVGFGSLLGPERPLATAVTVLSPIDEDPIEWTNPAKATPVVTPVDHHHHAHHGMNPSISSLTSLVDHQLQQQLSQHEVITEDENGKSYFNLGTPDSTILARKSSSDNGWGGSSSCGGGGGSSNDFDDAISSSSCDSISSEDLFNSGEEFDASDDDDEDELCTYKQQRSTVLHLSLCKLNKFRTNCVEPSLHRSVLICNTLRHIEQEIRNEDEADESLKSRERLPSFWPSAPPNPNPNSQNNCFPPHNSPGNPGPQSSQPQITDTRPNGHIGTGLGVGPIGGGGGIPSLINGNGAPAGMLAAPPNGGHDPYLSPNPYSEAPYLTAYDYNPPRPTPFHTTSYDYEQDLLLPPPPNASPTSTAPSQASSSVLLSEVTSATSSLLECDSGYSDDLDMSLSSYYYGSPIPPPPVVPVTSSQPNPNNLLQPNTADFSNAAMSSSITGASSSTGAIQVSSICAVVTTTASECSPYLQQCSSFQTLPPQQATSVSETMSAHLLANGGDHIPLHTGPQPPPPSQTNSSGAATPMEISDLGDIEIRNGSSSPSCNGSLSPPSSTSLVGGAVSDYMASAQSATNPESTITTSSGSSSSTCVTPSWVVSNDEHLAAKDSLASGGVVLHQELVSTSQDSSLSPSNSPPHQSPPSSTMVMPPITTLLTTSTTTTSLCTSPNTTQPQSSSLANAFAQQDSQCGLESRRSDLSRNVGNHYNNHNLPMDSLISPAYSSSSL